MAVTPNYGWPVPVATDYVKDGWEAISDLGNAIDTTVAGLSSGALTYIGGSTFSAQSTVSYNNVFTSTYNNYKIIFTGLGSTGAEFLLRLRASGTDYTTATHHTTSIERAGAGFFSGASGSSNAAIIGLTRPTKTDIEVTIYNPQVASTQVTLTSNGMYFQSGSNHGNYLGGCAFNTNSSYDGFSLIPVSGTITGTVRIYGISNS